MSLTLFLAFVGTETILCLTPGPAVMLVISQALTSSARGSAWGTAGILSANAVYFTLSALGVGSVLLASAAVFTAVKWCGVVYLVWIGLSMMFNKRAVDTEVTIPVCQRSSWRSSSSNRVF